MATLRQSGGDYGSLNAACAASETTIDIDQSWTVADTTAVAATPANCTITVSGGAAHPGYISGGNYYRLEVNSAGSHCITQTSNNLTIIGMVIKQASTNSSDECIRIDSNITPLTTRRCIMYGNSTYTSSQDGIYHQTGVTTVNAEQCVFFRFGRAGIHLNSNTDGSTVNANSCTFAFCGGGTTEGGGIFCRSDNNTVNSHNNVGFDCDLNADSGVFNERGTQASTWNISNCIDDDGSTSVVIDTGSNNLESRTATDNASPGAGDWIIFENITTYPFDLRLKSSAENDAQDRHANASAHGMTIPGTDIIGTVRPQNTNYDVGAFEIVSGAAATSRPPSSRARYFANLLQH